MGKTVEINVRSLFRERSDVARLQPDPSFVACLDPCQHFLKDSGRDFFGWHVTFFVGAVGETVLLEEPTRAALAPLIPLGALVKLLACKIFDPSSFASMQILPCGDLFFISWRALSFPMPLFLSRLSLSASLRLPVSSGPEVLVAFGDFIEKVGGRIM